uniref:Pre-mRNA-splicing factor 18 n=1 Tax=Caenorhabditis tropicalis TaxID=1561998 RepID=A0A1I7TDG3_9PELO
MDFKAKLLAEVAKKRKAVSDLEVKDGGAKYLRGADLESRRNQEYEAKQEEIASKKRKIDEEAVQEASNQEKIVVEKSEAEIDEKTPIADIHFRLRQRGQPILLFGESEYDVRRRLHQLELAQPDLNEGWENELQTAMKVIGKEMDKAVVEGTADSATRHDIALPKGYEEDNWKSIEHSSTLLGVGDDMKRDCDIILSICRYILARWARDLNDRPLDVKKTAQGMHEAAHHKQTVMHLKSLMTSMEKYNVNNDIRHHLAKICKLLVIERNYLEANNAYMEMAIGNAPWPVGVTRSGIHQRPGSAKAYVSNIAHVLNDETQRKYIQAFKRLMTKLQEYFPTDPSKSVEYVKKTV